MGKIKRKRIKAEEIQAFPPGDIQGERACVIVIGATELWLQKQVIMANDHGLHPIVLSNWPHQLINMRYSTVSMDIPDSMHRAADYLRQAGKKKTALYGVNPHSNSDKWREEIFAAMYHGPQGVYANKGSLKSTFDCFYKDMHHYDSVICTSDYAAISLVKELKERKEEALWQLYIISYGNLFLTQYYRPSITSIADRFEDFGKAALSICTILEKEGHISTVNVQLEGIMHIRETTAFHPYAGGATVLPVETEEENSFFKEEQIREMGKVEMLLGLCDTTDLEIIRCLIQGDYYADIGAKCFISESAVKYRVREFGKICGTDTRGNLVRLLKKYL